MNRVELVARIYKAVGIKKKPGLGYLTRNDLMTIAAFVEGKAKMGRNRHA